MRIQITKPDKPTELQQMIADLPRPKVGRKPLPAGEHRIASSITMSPEAWAILDRICAEHFRGSKKTRSRAVEHFVRNCEKYLYLYEA
jgi:hypothetical protein